VWFGRDELIAAGEQALRRCTDLEIVRARDGERTPHLQRGSAGRFGDLMDLARLDDLLNDDMLRVLGARTLLAGEAVAESRDPTSGDAVSGAGRDVATASTVCRHVALGATLSLQGVQRVAPALAEFCRSIAAALTHRVQANLYASPPNESSALGWHRDVHDVIVLQVHGSKRWETSDPNHPDGGMAVDLADGDSLYLPRGWPHRATATSSSSVHLTIGILPTTVDFAAAYYLRSIADDGALQMSLPVGYAREAPRSPDAGFSSRVLVEAADFGAVESVLAARFWAHLPRPVHGRLQAVIDRPRPAAETRIQRCPGAVIRVDIADDVMRIGSGDLAFDLPSAAWPVVSVALGEPDLTLRSLAVRARCDDASVIAVVERLACEGLITLG